MGTLLKGTKYSIQEYIEALAITFGVAMFSFGQNDGDSEQIDPHVQFIGFLLLSTYVLSDSFTAQYQNKIYSEYGKLNQYHMMFGVNVSSIIITSIAMLFSGEIYMVAEFLYMNPRSGWYNLLTAICSTTGQVAIYYTIKRFGPITFVIIMTTRQMFSMIISTVLFSHSINMMGIIGSLFVFAAVFHSIYRQNVPKIPEAIKAPKLDEVSAIDALGQGSIGISDSGKQDDTSKL
jgi:adenosine 3'-phospho 5'-phosphosulfate transporter B2